MITKFRKRYILLYFSNGFDENNFINFLRTFIGIKNFAIAHIKIIEKYQNNLVIIRVSHLYEKDIILATIFYGGIISIKVSGTIKKIKSILSEKNLI